MLYKLGIAIIALSPVSTVFLVIFPFCHNIFNSQCFIKPNDPIPMSGSSQTYSFNTCCNFESSTKVNRNLKMCVSFADEYSKMGEIWVCS